RYLIMIDIIARILEFVVGSAIVMGTFISAIRTFVLPRSAQDQLTRIVFIFVRRCFDLLNRRSHTYTDRDRVMAFYAPVALLSLPPTWLISVLLGYMLL